MSESLSPVVAIVGPTGSGKAALGLDAAERLELPILVCDSVKVYRRLDIGSAKPGADARSRVTHHLIDLVDPDGQFTARQYAAAAWAHLDAHAGRGLFVGGTGFYLRAALWRATGEGDAETPTLEGLEREAFEARWAVAERGDAGATHRALAAVDPETAAGIHPNNWVRVVRALGLCDAAGGPISAIRASDPPRPRARMLFVWLDPGEALRERQVRRVDRMLAQGWLAEVEALVAAGYDERHKSMRSLGYKQLVDVVKGRCGLDAAREDILKATWQYARRQRTYFRHQLPAEDVVHIPEPSAMPWDRVQAFLDSSAQAPPTP